MTVAPGKRAPAFDVETTEGTANLASLLAEGPLVLAFYVEDATPACTAELCSFRDEYATLRKLGARVLGVSADSLDSHRRFAARVGGLPFPLAADPELALAHAYGVVEPGDRRARRAVFVIGSDGVVLAAIPHYQPAVMGHFAAVFEALGLAS